MIGSPIDARGVTTLEHQGQTVGTWDPLGASRSERTDDAKESTPAEHADVVGVAADWVDRQRDLWERLFACRRPCT